MIWSSLLGGGFGLDHSDGAVPGGEGRFGDPLDVGGPNGADFIELFE
jgi:hypothetical protein